VIGSLSAAETGGGGGSGSGGGGGGDTLRSLRQTVL